MKTLLTLITLVALTTSAFASPAHGGNKRMGKVIVKGAKAELIYKALSTVDVKTKDTPRFTAEIKKVGTLRCAKLTSKEDTTVVKFRCALRGKKTFRRGSRGNGRVRNGSRRHRGPRRGGRGHGHRSIL